MSRRDRTPSLTGPRRVLRTICALLLALAVPACAPRTAIQSAGSDQEITRAILWEYRNHPALSDVRVSCSDHHVRLEGRVPDAAARDQALRIAAAQGRGAPVEDRMSIKPR